jgi:hypothetical protein
MTLAKTPPRWSRQKASVLPAASDSIQATTPLAVACHLALASPGRGSVANGHRWGAAHGQVPHQRVAALATKVPVRGEHHYMVAHGVDDGHPEVNPDKNIPGMTPSTAGIPSRSRVLCWLAEGLTSFSHHVPYR